MHEATLYINFASVVPTAMWLQGQSKRAVASALVTPFQSYDVLLYTMPVAVPIFFFFFFLIYPELGQNRFYIFIRFQRRYDVIRIQFDSTK